MTRVPRTFLLIGLPRSGTTFLAETLGRLAGAPPMHEPDNEKEHVGALLAKRGLGRFPALRPGESAPGYRRLWERALTQPPRAGHPRWSTRSRVTEVAVRTADRLPPAVSRIAPRRVGHAARSPLGSAVVKSVHAPLAAEWLKTEFPDLTVVVIVRHPANILASWLELGLADRDRRLDERSDVRRTWLEPWAVRLPGADPIQRAAWQVCLLQSALLDQAGRHATWHLVEHEVLCRDLEGQSRALADRLQLPWSGDVSDHLRASDRPGTAYSLARRAVEQPERWRERLPREARIRLADVIVEFPHLDRWHDVAMTG